MDDVTALRDALVTKWYGSDALRVVFSADLDALIAAAEQRGRDQWLRATSHGARQWEGLLAKYDLAEDADASSVIAAVEARAALTPERLAKALHHEELCWDGVDECVGPEWHGEAARILAALATDEAVP